MVRAMYGKPITWRESTFVMHYHVRVRDRLHRHFAELLGNLYNSRLEDNCPAGLIRLSLGVGYAMHL